MGIDSFGKTFEKYINNIFMQLLFRTSELRIFNTFVITYDDNFIGRKSTILTMMITL